MGIVICMMVFVSDLGSQTGSSKKEIVFESFMSDRSVTVADIKELTRRSTDIIIGRPLANKSQFRRGGRQEDFHMMHLVLVQTVLKGDIKNGSSVELRMPGGVLINSDGNVVNRQASDSRPLRENASFFIFMKKTNGQNEQVYIPALGIQSIFEIDPDTNTIIPCDMVKSVPVVQKYLNAPMGAFFNEILSEVSSEIRRK
jgi:hypothetical protein